ncbi:MAG: hypothetical protein M3P34_10635 [Actinomycetota bacterium]|nr:hypothetical protein [Actinomycetota bacterium]
MSRSVSLSATEKLTAGPARHRPWLAAGVLLIGHIVLEQTAVGGCERPFAGTPTHPGGEDARAAATSSPSPGSARLPVTRKE